jgi:hypothetical protein
LPPQLGVFKNTVYLSIADGLESIELRVMGESSKMIKKILIKGTDKLPDDFKPHHKFVDPEEEENTRLEKKKANERKLKLQSTLSSAINSKTAPEDITVSETSSLERDYIYGMDNHTVGDNDEILSHSAPLDSTHPFIQRKENNLKYDLYLRDTSIERSEKKKKEAQKKLISRGVIDISDPFSSNMGMERGLEEPILKIPLAGEPLWLASRGKDGDGAGPNRLPIDENRLINKKYSNVATTQAEMRDCTAELSLDQLKLVYGSHKV